MQIPLLAVAVLLYNLLAFTMSDASAPLFTMPLPSGARWGVSAFDLVSVAALALLFVELGKSTRTSNASIIDHSLSVLLFAGCLVEFISVQKAGTTTFFMLMMMTMMDVVAGFMVTLTGSRRDIYR